MAWTREVSLGRDHHAQRSTTNVVITRRMSTGLLEFTQYISFLQLVTGTIGTPCLPSADRVKVVFPNVRCLPLHSYTALITHLLNHYLMSTTECQQLVGTRSVTKQNIGLHVEGSRVYLHTLRLYMLQICNGENQTGRRKLGFVRGDDNCYLLLGA